MLLLLLFVWLVWFVLVFVFFSQDTWLEWYSKENFLTWTCLFKIKWMDKQSKYAIKMFFVWLVVGGGAFVFSHAFTHLHLRIFGLPVLFRKWKGIPSDTSSISILVCVKVFQFHLETQNMRRTYCSGNICKNSLFTCVHL